MSRWAGSVSGMKPMRLAGLFRIVDQRDAVDVGIALGGVVQGGQDAHGRRFARAVGTDKAEDMARGKAERNVVDRLGLAEVAFQIDNANVHRPALC